jgi:voltage-gated potassium channel Kch
VAAPLIAVVALSMGLTPLLMLVNEKLVQPRFGTRERAGREADAIDEHNPVIVAGFGRFGHVIGRLLVANGVGTTILDVDSDHVDMLRKIGMKVFYGDASRHDLLQAAGADKAKLLVLAVDRPEKSLEIVRTVKKHFPHLEILARARGRPHAYELLDAEVEHVYREHLDTSLRVGVDALRRLGFRSHQAIRAARKFRRHDEANVRELAPIYGDRKSYIVRAREMVRDLEETMRADLEGAGHELDAAWDTASAREEFGRLAE